MCNVKRYDEELNALYKIVCEEMADLNLRTNEIRNCVYTITNLIVMPRLDSNHPDMQTEMFTSPDNSKVETLVAFREVYGKDESVAVPNLSEFHLCDNQRLSKILSRFLESYTLPSHDACQDYMKSLDNVLWNKSMLYQRAYYREKKVENGEIKWSLISIDNKISKEIPDVAYIWAERQGMCRFITTMGRWGYVDVNTFETILLSENIVVAHDFCDGRALIFASEKFAQKIVIDDGYFPDYNPHGFYYAHIDMRGNIIKQYTSASEYKNNIATVNLKEGALWGYDAIEDRFENPYTNVEVDIMGNPLPKYQSIIDETVKKVEEEEDLIEREKRHREFMRDILRPDYDDEDSIMSALENGHGDIYGF